MGVDPISIGIMAAGTLLQAGGAIKGMMDSQRLAHDQKSQADFEQQQQVLQQVRQARIQRAKVLQAGENQGAGGSSSVTTGASGVIANEGQNVNFIDTDANLNRQITNAKQAVGTDKGIQDLGKSVFNFGDGGVGNIFG